MEFAGEYTIPVPQSRVWEALNDPAVLKECLAGCQELEKISETQFDAKVVIRVGAIKARMNGSVELSDVDEPNSYTISGRGQGGIAGFAKGHARVALNPDGTGGTVLHYVAAGELGGKLAAVGSRVIDGIARKMADDFFGKFARHLAREVQADRTGPEVEVHAAGSAVAAAQG